MVIQQLAVAAVEVECLQCAEVLSVVLETSPGGQVVSLAAVKLSDKDVPLLGAGGVYDRLKIKFTSF